ncbi:hypothetical protein D3C86_861520 [compost metagenome]
MKTQDNANPKTLLGHAIVFVASYEAAAELIKRMPDVKEFFVIGDNVRKVPTSVQTLFKERNARPFRIRTSGTWNPLFKAMGEVDDVRAEGVKYGKAGELMFISILSAHEISSALNRHRAVSQISCREMYWLDTLSLGEEADESIDLALRSMPSVLTPIAYKDLTAQQRFDLTAFEFARFTRPIHCVDSVENSYNGVAFYTNFKLGESFHGTRAGISTRAA